MLSWLLLKNNMSYNINEDYVGIVSPSAPVAAFCPKRLARGVEFLEEQGFHVLLSKNVSAVSGFTAGSAQDRAQDIMDMFIDKRVKIIIATIGGYNANDVLEYLDYNLITKNNDKMFIGYSDSTILLHALNVKSGVKTVMGPMILPQFAEFPQMQKFSYDSFLEIINNLGTGKIYKIPASDKYTEEMLAWDKDDIRAREMLDNKSWQVISSGKASGPLMPANLNTLNELVGTEYMPDLNEAILFLEDDSDEEASTVQRMLMHLKQAGLVNNIRGIIFGRFQQKSEIEADDIKIILKNVFGDYNFPVISNLDFGHTDPILSLPVGNIVNIDTDSFMVEMKL
ncbi:MAG: muramoyltetrapeptide carboxypeptidase [Patescibacteria group bacterium]|nr:muramoyltetrapeptide carboxypeptidase [Patescibacteria group bacterium]